MQAKTVYGERFKQMVIMIVKINNDINIKI